MRKSVTTKHARMMYIRLGACACTIECWLQICRFRLACYPLARESISQVRWRYDRDASDDSSGKKYTAAFHVISLRQKTESCEVKHVLPYVQGRGDEQT